jgi:hypothetical protein
MPRPPIRARKVAGTEGAPNAARQFCHCRSGGDAEGATRARPQMKNRKRATKPRFVENVAADSKAHFKTKAGANERMRAKKQQRARLVLGFVTIKDAVYAIRSWPKFGRSTSFITRRGAGSSRGLILLCVLELL